MQPKTKRQMQHSREEKLWWQTKLSLRQLIMSPALQGEKQRFEVYVQVQVTSHTKEPSSVQHQHHVSHTTSWQGTAWMRSSDPFRLRNVQRQTGFCPQVIPVAMGHRQLSFSFPKKWFGEMFSRPQLHPHSLRITHPASVNVWIRKRSLCETKDSYPT